MQQLAGPGDLLADRYLLVDLLTESGNGRFWRAHDQVLERHVALHCLAEDDARANNLTEAARVSATVLDRRILRVLDADRRDGMAYVVNEWGSGTSLDILVGADGTLPPRRAAWIVSEVAAAMAVAHEQQVAHGRLVPENILIDQSGQVRVIGFCVDAALLGLPTGQVSHDVDDIGGLLYFLLTGKWAGPSHSDVPPALRDHGKWLRPRQVRAGIPRVLDTICDQVLNPYNAEPGHQKFNLHTARGIADVLTEYVGDPTGLVQPAPVGGIAGAGVLAVPERRTPTRRPPAAEPAPEPEPEPTQLVPTTPPQPEPTVVMRVPPPAVPPLPDEGAPVSTPPPSQGDMPTQAGMPIFDDEAEDVAWLQKRSAPPPPPPQFEEPPERPLFAPTPPEGTPARTPRPGSTEPPAGDYWPWESSGPGTGSGSGVIPVVEPGEGHGDDGVPGRSWFRLAVLVALSLLLLVGVVIAYNLGRGKTPLGAEPEPASPSPSSSPNPEPATPIEGTTARALDPQGETPEENSDLAPLAVDGDPASAWPTSVYFDQLGPPPGLKTGVGLVVDLGESREVAQIDLTTVGSPTDITYFLTDSDPTAVAGLEPIAQETVSQERLRTRLDTPLSGQYLVVWITSLPAVGADFQAEIAEVVVGQVSQ